MWAPTKEQVLNWRDRITSACRILDRVAPSRGPSLGQSPHVSDGVNLEHPQTTGYRGRNV
jgi:hypothetical protein